MQFEVVDYSTIGECLSKAIIEANHFFEASELRFRFNDVEIHSDEAFDIYMAKKDNGKPKDDYPSKEVP
jgi:hypothetical protein